MHPRPSGRRVPAWASAGRPSFDIDSGAVDPVLGSPVLHQVIPARSPRHVVGTLFSGPFAAMIGGDSTARASDADDAPRREEGAGSRGEARQATARPQALRTHRHGRNTCPPPLRPAHFAARAG